MRLYERRLKSSNFGTGLRLVPRPFECKGLSLRAPFGRLRTGFDWAQDKLREAVSGREHELTRLLRRSSPHNDLLKPRLIRPCVNELVVIDTSCSACHARLRTFHTS